MEQGATGRAELVLGHFSWVECTDYSSTQRIKQLIIPGAWSVPIQATLPLACLATLKWPGGMCGGQGLGEWEAPTPGNLWDVQCLYQAWPRGHMQESEALAGAMSEGSRALRSLFPNRPAAPRTSASSMRGTRHWCPRKCPSPSRGPHGPHTSQLGCPVSVISWSHPSIPRETSAPLRQLLLALLQRNHKDRMDFGECGLWTGWGSSFPSSILLTPGLRGPFPMVLAVQWDVLRGNHHWAGLGAGLGGACPGVFKSRLWGLCLPPHLV